MTCHHSLSLPCCLLCGSLCRYPWLTQSCSPLWRSHYRCLALNPISSRCLLVLPLIPHRCYYIATFSFCFQPHVFVGNHRPRKFPPGVAVWRNGASSPCWLLSSQGTAPCSFESLFSRPLVPHASYTPFFLASGLLPCIRGTIHWFPGISARARSVLWVHAFVSCWSCSRALFSPSELPWVYLAWHLGRSRPAFCLWARFLRGTVAESHSSQALLSASRAHPSLSLSLVRSQSFYIDGQSGSPGFSVARLRTRSLRHTSVAILSPPWVFGSLTGAWWWFLDRVDPTFQLWIRLTLDSHCPCAALWASH